jgi:hypothetical protein
MQEETDLKLNVSLSNGGQTVKKWSEGVMAGLNKFTSYSSKIGGHDVKGGFCQAWNAKTLTAFDVKPFDVKRRFTKPNGDKTTFNVVNDKTKKMYFAGKICSPKMSSKALSNTFHNPGKSCAHKGNFFLVN